MGTDLIIPEIVLLEKMEETDRSFAPALWEGLKNEVIIASEEENKLPAAIRRKKRMIFTDFVNKAINQPMEFNLELTPEVQKQLYRLHLFAASRAFIAPRCGTIR